MQTLAKFDCSQLHYEVVTGEPAIRAHWNNTTVCSIAAIIDQDSSTFTPDYSNFNCSCCDENVRLEMLDILVSLCLAKGLTLA